MRPVAKWKIAEGKSRQDVVSYFPKRKMSGTPEGLILNVKDGGNSFASWGCVEDLEVFFQGRI